MMDILVILLALSVLNICVFMKCVTNISKRIDELEKNIYNIQYQTEDILCNINIVNQNVLNTYGLLVERKNKNEKDWRNKL